MPLPRAEGDTEEIRLELPGQLELLSIVDKVVDGIADQMSFEDDDKDAIAISVIEAGTNAIQHGMPGQPVQIVFRITPDALEVDVTDQGKGFDLDLVEDASAPENLLKARGRGIFIMRSMMDEILYDFSDRGTVCRLVKKRRSAVAEGDDGSGAAGGA